MGCGNCGTGASGKPSGCQSNGGCSSGGCNRLNVFDWLSGLPLYDSAKPYPVIEVTFSQGSRKEFYRNQTYHILEKGEMITVEGVSGYDVGQVSLTGELVKLQMKKYGAEDNPSMKKVLRRSTDEDMRQWQIQKNREQEVMVQSRAIARSLKLDMKVCEVEIQADGKKATFFYTADQRVDFRELIKVFASEFRVKVEMKQIGARQESAKVGGIGSCGRELCCSTWLTDFKSVNTTAARYQNLSINQTKLSGQCGRLKCCLNYELDTYMDALRVFPEHADTIHTQKGTAHLQKRDIFKSIMWYSYSDSSKQYPMEVAQVREILKMNKQGEKPEELVAVEIETPSERRGVKADMSFVNDVGQITLRNLEKGNRKKKSSGRKEQPGRGGDNRPRNAQQAEGQVKEREPRPERQKQEGRGERRERGERRQREGSANPSDPNGQSQNNQNNRGDRPKQERRERPARPEGQQPQPEGGRQKQPGNPRPQRSERRDPAEKPQDAQQPKDQAAQDAPQQQEGRQRREQGNRNRGNREQGQGNREGRPPREQRPPRNPENGGSADTPQQPA